MPAGDLKYWGGMVVCHRKGLCHIRHKKCHKMYDVELCGGCPCHVTVLRLDREEAMAEALRKAERAAMVTPRKMRKK